MALCLANVVRKSALAKSAVQNTERADTMATGSFVIDTARTFESLMLVSSGPKLKFQSPVQDVTGKDELKWEVHLVGRWHPRNGMPAVSEVLKVTFVGGTSEPANGLPAGTLVELADFTIGMSAPEHNTKGGIKGGKPFYGATAVRAAGSVNGRKYDAKPAENAA